MKPENTLAMVSLCLLSVSIVFFVMSEVGSFMGRAQLQSYFTLSIYSSVAVLILTCFVAKVNHSIFGKEKKKK